MIDNQKNITLYAIRIPKRYAPLLQLEYEFKKAQRMDGMQLAFALIIELWKLITGNNIEPSSPKPLSPALRQEVRKLDQTLKEYKLLCENQIDSAQKLVSFIEKKSTDISALESERQKIYNRMDHSSLLQCIRSGLVMMIPILMIGSLALLLRSLPERY